MKVAIIGCGRIAQVRHIPQYATNKKACIVGFYDIVFERAKELADTYNAKAYKSVDELLNDESVDAVSVCVANSFHSNIAISAMKAGKQVLCEKPMATTLKECKDMIACAKKTGKKLMIAHDQRYDKAHIKAKELLDNGVIGRLLTFKSNFCHAGPESWSIDKGNGTWFFDKSKSSLGVVADLGVHKIDLLQFLLNTKITEVFASFDTLDKKYASGKPIDLEDNAICLFRTQNGMMGSLNASWTSYGKSDNSTTIFGSDGIMIINEDELAPVKVILKDGTNKTYDCAEVQSVGVINAFVDCIVNDTTPPINCEEVLHAMKVVFACKRSANTKKAIKVI